MIHSADCYWLHLADLFVLHQYLVESCPVLLIIVLLYSSVATHSRLLTTLLIALKRLQNVATLLRMWSADWTSFHGYVGMGMVSFSTAIYAFNSVAHRQYQNSNEIGNENWPCPCPHNRERTFNQRTTSSAMSLHSASVLKQSTASLKAGNALQQMNTAKLLLIAQDNSLLDIDATRINLQDVVSNSLLNESCHKSNWDMSRRMKLYPVWLPHWKISADQLWQSLESAMFESIQ
jgi:hypothetical protein